MPAVRRLRSASRGLGPASTPTTIWVLLGLNVLVYVLWSTVGKPGTEGELLMGSHFLVSVPHLQAGYYWTLLTSAFSHNEPTHLLFNMLALWVFGKDVCRVVGRWSFVHLYVVGGVLASLAHVGFSYAAGSDIPALGASGAVMAIAVLYAALYPKRRLLINFIIPVPAALAVAGYVVLDLLGMLGVGGAGIANAAHLGGALYGFVWWLTMVRPKVGRRTR